MPNGILEVDVDMKANEVQRIVLNLNESAIIKCDYLVDGILVVHKATLFIDDLEFGELLAFDEMNGNDSVMGTASVKNGEVIFTRDTVQKMQHEGISALYILGNKYSGISGFFLR